MTDTLHSINASGAGFTTLSAEKATFYNKNLLARLNPELHHGKFAKKYKLPKGHFSMDVRRYERLTPSQTPTQLTDGTTPATSALSVTKYTFEPKQYGDYAIVSDRLDMQGIDPTILEFTDIFGQYGGETFDIVIRNSLLGNGSIQYVNGKTLITNIGENDQLTVKEAKKAVRTLRRNNVKPFANNKYVALIHTDVEFDITEDEDWKELNVRQEDGKNVYGYKVGTLNGCDVYATSQAQIQAGAGASVTTSTTKVRFTGAKADVYSSYVFGYEAFGSCDLDGDDAVKPKTIVIKANGTNTADPLNQRNTVGYKGMITGLVLQSLALIEVRHAASL